MGVRKWLSQTKEDFLLGGKTADVVQAQQDLSGTARDNRHTVLPISGG